ncbi:MULTISPECIES: hypothetical protein [Streptomyces]|uniref:hypothetical protein n=1 Tax=Streptomyces TaxID=1883 RepID=UPI0014893551|nr:MULTISPECIES: hypothetical protein [Streptomyces]
MAVTAVTFVAAAPLAGAQTAYASVHTSAFQPYPPELSSTTVPAGGVIFFSAEGFEPGETVTATLVPQSTALNRALVGNDGNDGNPDGKTCGTRYRANEAGTVIGCFEVPKDTPPGPYLFTLTGQQSGSVSAPVTVTPRKGNGYGEREQDGPDGASADATAGSPNQQGTSLVLTQDTKGQPGAVTVAGNGLTLSVKGGTAEEQPGSNVTSQKSDLAPAGYDVTGHAVSGGTQPTETGSTTHWALAGGAAGLTAVAVKTITVVRRRRTRTEQG